MFKQTFKDAWLYIMKQQKSNNNEDSETKTQLSSSTLMPKTEALCVILKYVDPSIKKFFSRYIKIYNFCIIFLLLLRNL